MKAMFRNGAPFRNDMRISRRHALAYMTGAAISLFAPGSIVARDAAAQSLAPLQPNVDRDQTSALQALIDNAAARQAPVILPPGSYRAGQLRLPPQTHLIGARGATKLIFSGNAPSLMDATGPGRITLSGLVLDGAGQALPRRRGLLHAKGTNDLVISDCEFVSCNGSALWLDQCKGQIRNNTIRDISDSAIVLFDSQGLLIAQNTIAQCGDNGIEILRQAPGDDSSQVIDNRIHAIRARGGGSGQHGNGIVVHRAGGVIVRGNTIRDCDYSAIRGNSAANIQILGNNIAHAREVAIYSEFAFEGAIIADNLIDVAAIGISVCNFNEGGRLAIVRGNLIRNLLDARPAGSADGQGGVGIYVEADTIVSGNLVEKAKLAGIMVGWGKYARDALLADNLLRECGIGIAVTANPQAGNIKVSGNVIAKAARGAIIGMDHAKPITGDLMLPGATSLPHLTLDGNHKS
jgi:uncharacterized secreted repeat protein (TIGR03808 family)